MLRKLFIYLIFLAVIGGLAYGYLYYGVVALYEPGQPKVTYLCVTKKPHRDIGFFYNHFDESTTRKEVSRLVNNNDQIPWHLDYNWVINHSVYIFTMDNRNLGK